MPNTLRLTAISLSVSLLLAACGGGGGGSPDTTQPGTGTTPTTNNPGTNNPGTGNPPAQGAALPEAVPATASMSMTCAGGAAVQCSGDSVIRTDNGVALTSSGVQVYGRSTSDLATPIVNKAAASGFALTSGGLAEMRVNKDANALASSPALLLSNLGIKWDGTREAPLIIETFSTDAGRVQLNPDRTIAQLPLPATSDTAFYDFENVGRASTKFANYWNNRYFPRTEPSRCPPPTPAASCPSVETTGLARQDGDWRIGGSRPDMIGAIRLHEDGDIHAGKGGGVPFPGSKGYRSFDNVNYQFANLTKWVSQDTVEIAEWVGALQSNEHNQNRRGLVAFGDVTPVGAVPTTGSATYSGVVRGWHTPNAGTDPTSFVANATMQVNFATRQVTITIADAKTDSAAATTVPVSFTATVGMGAAGSNVANYLTGTVTAGSLTGGISGRYFGKDGPAEAGSTFSLSNATTGEAVIAGFVARRQ